MKRVLAADVGGTTTKAARVDAGGHIEDRREEPTPRDPAEGVALIARLWDALGPGEGRALAVAGGIRDADGEITQSPNLQRWEGTRPGVDLACGVLNDANAALLGEAWCGALEGARSAVLLTLGTGVGGGGLLDGRLWTGAGGCAGEIGHVPVWPDGPPGSTGARGYLELYASARGVAKAAGTRDAAEAAKLARGGEPRCRGAFRKAGEALGIALSGLVNAFNPEAICIGGGMAPALDLMIDDIWAELRARAFRLALEGLEVVPAALGNDAGLLGAAFLALEVE